MTYFALRSYLPAGHDLKALEIGSEPTPAAFIGTMVAVFREVRRVLHPSGLVFVNLGDSYASGKGSCFNPGGGEVAFQNYVKDAGMCVTERPNKSDLDRWGLQPGDLMNIPHRVAEALRGDGWIWRQTIIWAKRSPMPESCQGWRWTRCRVKVKAQENNSPAERVGRYNIPGAHASVSTPAAAVWSDCPGCPKCRDHGGYVLRRGSGRCTTSHEYVFVLAKSRGYFWDSAAFVEEATTKPHRSGYVDGHEYAVGPMNRNGHSQREQPDRVWSAAGTRNPRSVWTISSEPTSEKHFAAFPSELVRRCVQAGTSDGGCCPECGMPWAPVVESTAPPSRMDYDGKNADADKQSGHRRLLAAVRGARAAGGEHNNPFQASRILAYRPTCSCGRTDAAPCRVLDPFMGTGTTLQTARQMGRDSVGIELNPAYVEIAERRVQQPPRWWVRRQKKVNGKARQAVPELTLFEVNS